MAWVTRSRRGTASMYAGPTGPATTKQVSDEGPVERRQSSLSRPVYPW